MRMHQVRDRNAKSVEPYIHKNSKIQGVLQKSLQNGIYPPTADSSNNETTLTPRKANVSIDISDNIKVKVDDDPSPTKKHLKQEMKKKRKPKKALKK